MRFSGAVTRQTVGQALWSIQPPLSAGLCGRVCVLQLFSAESCTVSWRERQQLWPACDLCRIRRASCIRRWRRAAVWRAAGRLRGWQRRQVWRRVWGRVWGPARRRVWSSCCGICRPGRLLRPLLPLGAEFCSEECCISRWTDSLMYQLVHLDRYGLSQHMLSHENVCRPGDSHAAGVTIDLISHAW